MEEFNQNYLIPSDNNVTIFPYRPIPLPPISNTNFDPGYVSHHFIYRPTELSGPLDLSLRGPVPITPPTTPSPPRKRHRNETNNFSSINDDNIEKSNNNSPSPAKSPESSSSSEISVTNDDFIDITGQEDSDDDEVIVDSTDSIDENIGVLENGKQTLEDPEQHIRAVEGFARLFDDSILKPKVKHTDDTDVNVSDSYVNKDENSESTVSVGKNLKVHSRLPKSEKKKFKTRKNLVDDDNSSPLSGIIIRKLRDDEELVVRKVRKL